MRARRGGSSRVSDGRRGDAQRRQVVEEHLGELEVPVVDGVLGDAELDERQGRQERPDRRLDVHFDNIDASHG